MKIVGPLCLMFFCGLFVASAQNPPPVFPASEPNAGVLNELTKITRSVQTLSDRMKAFVDKFEKVGGLTLTEKQIEIVFGMEILVRTEQLIAALQKSQIDLTEKLNETRNKMAQVDADLRPRSIDRSVSLVGTTETEELRENKRQKLLTERTSLRQLSSQIEENLAETNEKLRDSQTLSKTLRRQFLPQIDREINKQQP